MIDGFETTQEFVLRSALAGFCKQRGQENEIPEFTALGDWLDNPTNPHGELSAILDSIAREEDGYASGE